jgi:hypothetical protein
VSRAVDVELRSSYGRHVETVDVGLLATDSAAVDMARRQAGIPASEFDTGEVVAP